MIQKNSKAIAPIIIFRAFLSTRLPITNVTIIKADRQLFFNILDNTKNMMIRWLNERFSWSPQGSSMNRLIGYMQRLPDIAYLFAKITPLEVNDPDGWYILFCMNSILVIYKTHQARCAFIQQIVLVFHFLYEYAHHSHFSIQMLNYPVYYGNLFSNTID